MQCSKSINGPTPGTQSSLGLRNEGAQCNETFPEPGQQSSCMCSLEQLCPRPPDSTWPPLQRWFNWKQFPGCQACSKLRDQYLQEVKSLAPRTLCSVLLGTQLPVRTPFCSCDPDKELSTGSLLPWQPSWDLSNLPVPEPTDCLRKKPVRMLVAGHSLPSSHTMGALVSMRPWLRSPWGWRNSGSPLPAQPTGHPAHPCLEWGGKGLG